MNRIDKNRPTPEWIAALRERFPCEREVARVLDRKLSQRAGPPFQPVSLDTLVAGTRSLLRSHLGDDFEISGARWLSGGASKLQMAFDLDWNDPASSTPGRTRTPLVLRMEPSEAISETSRLREFELIQAVENALPVPKAYWHDAFGEHLPHPAIVYGFAQGVAKPTASGDTVSGVGTFFPPAIRQTLGHQFVDHMARLHALDWRALPLTSFDRPEPGTQSVAWELNHWERVWEEDVNEDVPLMRLAMGWLRQNMPPVDHVSVVHGDYRTGNFLFTEQDNRISAILDWEMAYLGDRHGDLAWAMSPTFGYPSEDDGAFLYGGFLTREEFIARYEQTSGLQINPDTLRYYDIFGAYKVVVICLATGHRAPRNGKTHQDVLVSWLIGVSYSFLDNLRVKLEAAL